MPQISDLSPVTSLTGVETFPLVQAGQTRKASLDQLPFLQTATAAVVRTLLSKVGDVISVKDFGAKGDNIADDTAALNVAAAGARVLGNGLYISNGTYRVSGTIDFTGLTVVGQSDQGAVIQATSAQFDVVKTEGNSLFSSFGIHGGWDGSTASQSGSGIKIGNATNTAYNVHMEYVRVQFVKQHGVLNDNGAYSSMHACKINACGSDGIRLLGTNLTQLITTISITGQTTASDCPYGYGLHIFEGAAINVNGFITENTFGILVNGNNNRSIALQSVWQEGTIGGKFLTLPPGTSAGTGLSVRNCFGGGTTTIDNNANWSDVFFEGNSALVENSMTKNGRVLTATSAEVVRSTTDSFTLTSLSLPPGMWTVHSCVQVQDAGGATVTKVGFVLTGDNTLPGLNSSTNASFAFNAAQTSSFGGDDSARLHLSTIYENALNVNQTVYMRCYTEIGAGSLAVKGEIKAVKFS